MSAEKIDFAVTTSETVTPAAIQARFSTLQDLDETQMATLNKKLLRRIDWRLMPTITIMFLMNYLDRINISNARIAGLQDDLGMSDTMWSTAISMFYVGYLIGQLPGNLWLARVRPSILLPSMMVSASSRFCLRVVANLIQAWLERLHDLRACLHLWSRTYYGSLRDWSLRGSLLPGHHFDDFIVVYKGRESHEDGHLARRKHDLQHHLRFPRGWHPSPHGRRRRSLQLAMVFYH